LGPEKAAGAKKIRFRFHEKPPGKGRFPQKLKNAPGALRSIYTIRLFWRKNQSSVKISDAAAIHFHFWRRRRNSCRVQFAVRHKLSKTAKSQARPARSTMAMGKPIRRFGPDILMMRG
jgi:hypothetical protein